jgi:hypothetical protein
VDRQPAAPRRGHDFGETGLAVGLGDVEHAQDQVEGHGPKWTARQSLIVSVTCLVAWATSGIGCSRRGVDSVAEPQRQVRFEVNVGRRSAVLSYAAGSRTAATDEYEVLMSAALLRKLLLDKSRLIDQVNRIHRLDLRFRISGVSPETVDIRHQSIVLGD